MKNRKREIWSYLWGIMISNCEIANKEAKKEVIAKVESDLRIGLTNEIRVIHTKLKYK